MDHRDLLNTLLAGQELSASQATIALARLLQGDWDPSISGAFLALLQSKGVTSGELTALASALRALAVPVACTAPHLVDTCGTGGGPTTFNISTAAAIAAAAAGATVAKHGNRAVTSQCGSADVLEVLGVQLSTSPAHAERLLTTCGIAFLFAPAFHPALAKVGPVRRALGIRTVFNQLGPLLNPASAPSQLVGVFDPNLIQPTAEALLNLGVERAWVVCGAEGLDEISPCGTTYCCQVAGSGLRRLELHPSQWGTPTISMASIAAGGTIEDNGRLLRLALSEEDSPHALAVCANAGAALFLAGKASDIGEGFHLARDMIASGKAAAKLDQWVEVSQQDEQAG